MIGIKGQYTVSISIGPFDNFLNEKDLKHLAIYEYSGNIAPQFEIIFQTAQDTIMEYINEGNFFNIGLGKDSTDEKIIYGVPQSVKSQRQGKDNYIINCKGTIQESIEYNNVQKIRSFRSMNVPDLVFDIVDAHSIDTIVDIKPDSSTQDLWVQHNITDKMFVDEVIKRYYRKGSFLALAIDSEGNFIIKDLDSITDKEPDWIIVYPDSGISGENIIIYDLDSEFVSQSGVTNKWAGITREQYQYDLHKDEFINITDHGVEPLFTGNDFNRNQNYGKRTSNFAFIDECQHKDFVKAIGTSFQSMALFSSHPLKLSYTNQFKNVRPLDLATFLDNPIESPNNIPDYFSGNYIVESVTTLYADSAFRMYVTLTRESLNKITGSFM